MEHLSSLLRLFSLSEVKSTIAMGFREQAECFHSRHQSTHLLQHSSELHTCYALQSPHSQFVLGGPFCRPGDSGGRNQDTVVTHTPSSDNGQPHLVPVSSAWFLSTVCTPACVKVYSGAVCRIHISCLMLTVSALFCVRISSVPEEVFTYVQRQERT